MIYDIMVGNYGLENTCPLCGGIMDTRIENYLVQMTAPMENTALYVDCMCDLASRNLAINDQKAIMVCTNCTYAKRKNIRK
jgi:hypothetical protein